MSDFKLNFNGRAANPDDSAGNFEIKVDADGLLEHHPVHRSSDKQEGPGGGIIIRTVLISSFNKQRNKRSEPESQKERWEVKKREVGGYLNRNGASKGIEVFKQLPYSDLIPRVSVLLPEDFVGGEVVEDGGAAVGGGFGEELGLGRRVERWVEKGFEDPGPGLPESGCNWGVVHAWPQTQRFS